MKASTTILGFALCGFLTTAAFAQGWPARPIRIIVGAAGGTVVDLGARLSGGEMAKRLGATVIIENRPGAASALAAKTVVSAEPDGTYILIGGATNHLLVKEPLILGKDLTPIGDVYQQPLALIVRGSLGVKTFQELVAYAKANPGKLNYGSSAITNEFVLDQVRSKSGGLSYIVIQYRAGTPIKELMGGEVDITVGSVGAYTAQIEAGKILPLLFFAKAAAYPNVPAAHELGLMPVPHRIVVGLFGPPGMSQDVQQRLSNALIAGLKTQEVSEGLRKVGAEAYPTTPEQQLREYRESAAFLLSAAKAVNFVPQQ